MSLKHPVYFDYAATTPVDPKVLVAMLPFFSDNFYNPSAIYQKSRDVKKLLANCRSDVAKCLGAKDSEIVFTAGASEANNLAIRGVMENQPGANLVVTAIEHDSVLNTAKNYDHKICAVNQLGIVEPAELAKLIDDKTVLVSVMLANNEIGTIQPLKEIAEIINRVRGDRLSVGNQTPLYLHSDAAQGLNYTDIHVSRLGVDLMSLNAGKIYGPKQSGALYVKAGVVLAPIIYGGGQEYGLRSGTENIPAIVGLAEAIKITEKIKLKEVERLKKLQKLLLEELEASSINFALNGSLKKRLPNNLNLTFFGEDNERLLILLDNAGFLVATGSACSASSSEPSHVLRALGLANKDINSTLRITFGRQTTAEDVLGLVAALKNLLNH
jgi:cysteine desulfurase